MQTESSAHSTRRHFLASNAMGLGGLALAWLLNEEKLLAGGGAVMPDLSRPHLRPDAQAARTSSRGPGR